MTYTPAKLIRYDSWSQCRRHHMNFAVHEGILLTGRQELVCLLHVPLGLWVLNSTGANSYEVEQYVIHQKSTK